MEQNTLSGRAEAGGAKTRWRASICFKGKRRCLGSYARFEDAVKARKQAEEAYFKTFLEECARAPRAAGARKEARPEPEER